MGVANMKPTEEVQIKETKATKHDIRMLEMEAGTRMEAVLWDFKLKLAAILELALEDIYGCAPTNYSESGVECFDEGISAAKKKIMEVLS